MNALGPDSGITTSATGTASAPASDKPVAPSDKASATPVALATPEPPATPLPATPTASPPSPAPVPAVATAAGPPGGTPAGAYRIGAQDVLQISVFKVPELTRSMQVGESGSVNMPLVGEITVAGRTAQEVERELTQKLGAKYLQNPQVTVSVQEFNSQRVTVDGAVNKPGVFPYRSSVSLLQVITMAGGLDNNSDSTVVVFRQKDGKRTAARFDVEAIRGGQAEDPAIEPGDTIVVGSSAVKTVFNNVLKALPLAGLFLGL